MRSNTVNALIMCGGNGQRWGHYLGIPKQQISFGGETLIERTVRLLQERKVANTTVVFGENNPLPGDYTSVITVRSSRWITEGLRETRKEWQGRTIVLLGDVFYTERAIDKILSCNRSLVFFGRSGASLRTGKLHYELFGMGLDACSADQVLKALENVYQHTLSGGKGMLWTLYRTVAGFSLNKHRVESNHFIEINDFTDDFDVPEDYRRAHRRFAALVSNSPWSNVTLWMLVACGTPTWLAKRSVKMTRRFLKVLSRWPREKLLPVLRRSAVMLVGEERIQRWLVIIRAN